MNSIVEVIEAHSKRIPDKAALIFNGEVITYQELTQCIFRFASSLKKKKIAKNSRILMEADDVFAYFCAFLGCHLYGCIAVPIEKNISIYKLQDIFATTKPKLVFMKNNGEKYEQYLEQEEIARFSMPKSDTVCTITSTTGTMGKPSQVAHTNKSILAAIENLAEGTKITEDTVLFTNIPQDLAAGYRRVLACFYKGATAVVSINPLNIDELTGLCEKYTVKHLSLLCSDIPYFVEQTPVDSPLTEMEIVESVTGELSAGITAVFYQKFPNTDFYNVYGSTESGCILINNTRDNYMNNCLGKPACNAAISLMDEMGNEIREPGKYGYVVVAGDMNMSGYYRKKEMTDKVMSNNHLVLNDIVYFDENGFYYFVSRVGDIINIKGYKVAPSSIENVAVRFPGVKDCACVGKKDAVNGQVPVLYIEKEPQSSLDMDELNRYLMENLESYIVPKEIHIIEKIPRTISGKLMRKSLTTIL